MRCSREVSVQRCIAKHVACKAAGSLGGKGRRHLHAKPASAGRQSGENREHANSTLLHAGKVRVRCCCHR